LLNVAGGHSGTLTFSSSTLNASAGTGLQFDDADGAYNFNGTTTLNGGDAGVDILNGSAGTFTFGTGAEITSPSGIAFNVDGGGTTSTCNVTYNGNITQANNVAMVNVRNHTTGTITFQTGTLSASNGTGLQFDNCDSTTSYNFNGTTTLNGGDAGIDIINGSAGNFTFANADITNPTGAAFLVNGGNGTISHMGTISKNNAGRLVDIQSRTGGSVTLTGNLSSTGTSTGINVSSCTGGTMTFSGTTKTLNTGANTAVSLTSNSGATINFTGGGLVITTTTATGFNATGGAAAVNATGSGNTITSGTGTALNVTSTTIGSSGLNFVSISSSGGSPNGIILDTTGSSGGLTVTGDGSNISVGGNSSGGTIANKTGADGSTTQGTGIYLNSTRNVVLRRMTINGVNQNFGIRGVNVTDFTLEYSTVSGANGDSTGLDEGSVNFDNLLGSAAITSCVIEGGLEDNLNVVNTSGTLNRLTVSGSTFGFNNTASGNNNILIESQNAGTTLNFTLKSSTIKGARADWINVANNSSSTGDTVIGGPLVADGNTFDNLSAGFVHPGAAAGGNRIVFGGVGTSTVDIRNNTTKGSKGEAIRVRSTAVGAVTGTVNARVRNNTIGVAATANSGSAESFGIFLFGDGGSDMTAAVTDNTIYQYNNHGISMTFGDEINDGSVFNVTVTGNTISNPGNINSEFNGFHLNNGTVGATDNFTTCLQLSGNNLIGSGNGVTSPNNQEFRLRQRQSTTVRLPGYGAANNDNAAVVAFLQGQNTVTAGNGAAANTVPTGGGFVGGAPCPTPP
jgi:hypothetical protein